MEMSDLVKRLVSLSGSVEEVKKILEAITLEVDRTIEDVHKLANKGKEEDEIDFTYGIISAEEAESMEPEAICDKYISYVAQATRMSDLEALGNSSTFLLDTPIGLLWKRKSQRFIERSGKSGSTRYVDMKVLYRQQPNTFSALLFSNVQNYQKWEMNLEFIRLSEDPKYAAIFGGKALTELDKVRKRYLLMLELIRYGALDPFESGAMARTDMVTEASIKSWISPRSFFKTKMREIKRGRDVGKSVKVEQFTQYLDRRISETKALEIAGGKLEGIKNTAQIDRMDAIAEREAKKAYFTREDLSMRGGTLIFGSESVQMRPSLAKKYAKLAESIKIGMYYIVRIPYKASEDEKTQYRYRFVRVEDVDIQRGAVTIQSMREADLVERMITFEVTLDVWFDTVKAVRFSFSRDDIDGFVTFSEGWGNEAGNSPYKHDYSINHLRKIYKSYRKEVELPLQEQGR